MFTIDIKVSEDVTRELKSIQQRLKRYPAEATDKFRALTPIRSGNARRHTNLRSEHIIADYPYAERLDKGWSKQAPQGMVKPFDVWVKQKLKSIFGK